jgi:hypothetical protein
MHGLAIAAVLAHDAVARKVHGAPGSGPAVRRRVAERLVREPARPGRVRVRAAGTLRGLADRLDSGATVP